MRNRLYPFIVIKQAITLIERIQSLHVYPQAQTSLLSIGILPWAGFVQLTLVRVIRTGFL